MERIIKYKKIICAAAFILAAVLMLSVSAFASSAKLADGAGLLTDAERTALEERLDKLSETLKHDIIVVTVESLDGKSALQYAHDYYDDHGFGYGETDSGILLLVCISTREYAISTCGDAEEIFGESDLSSLENAFLYDLKYGDYYEAFNSFADKCEEIIKYDKRLTPVWIAVSLIVGAVVAWIVIWSMKSKHRSVRSQRSADNYMLRNTFRVDRSRDVYLYSHTTRRLKPQNSSSGGSTRSSSGRSHGGRSGRF